MRSLSSLEGREHHQLDGTTEYPPEIVRDYRERGYWTGELLGDIVESSAKRNPEEIAVVGDAVRWTYRELAERIDRLSGFFAASNIKPDDRVVVHMRSEPAFVVVVFALWTVGALPVFTLPGHGSNEIAGFIRGSAATAVAVSCDRENGNQRRTVRSALDLVGATNCVAVYELNELADVMGKSGPVTTPTGGHKKAFRPHPQDVAFLQLSGGTTGASKLIPRTHDDYLYSVRASNEICRVSDKTVMLVALPAAHNFPMSSPGILGVLLAGGTCIFPADPSPATAFWWIENEAATTTALVPALLLSWLNSRKLASANLCSLQTVLVGGAPLDIATANRVKADLGATLQQVFGMAEGLVCYTRLDDAYDVIVGTQGRPMSPSDEIRIVDDAGCDVSEGESGHLLVRGPYTIRGYYQPDARALASFDSDGFYRSGDIVRRHPSGNLCVSGRAKDIVNRAGEKINPAEVEGLLRRCSGVADVAVFGTPDEVLGERLDAVVVATDATSPPRAIQLRRFLKEQGIAPFKVPDRISVADELPRTAVGKTAVRQLQGSRENK